jgi:hypothetical protein
MISPEPEERGEGSSWDQDEPDWLVGKQVVVGITRLASDGVRVKAQSQYHGKIVSADEVDGFKVECEGKLAGRTMTLPPNLSAFRIAKAGEQKLQSGGEIADEPEIISNWTIVEPSKS